MAGVAVLLTATVDVVWTDLPDPSTMDGHGGGGLALEVAFVAVALVGFVLGWRVGLVSLVGALLGELAGVFLACWVGDLLAGFLDPNSIQLSHYNNGWGALILILYVGVFLGPATVVTGVIGRLARYFFGGPAEHPSGTPS